MINKLHFVRDMAARTAQLYQRCFSAAATCCCGRTLLLRRQTLLEHAQKQTYHAVMGPGGFKGIRPQVIRRASSRCTAPWPHSSATCSRPELRVNVAAGSTAVAHLIIGALEQAHDAVAAQHEQARCRAGHERAVVADDEHAALEVRQQRLQRLHAAQVQVVGRLRRHLTICQLLEKCGPNCKNFKGLVMLDIMGVSWL